MAIMWFCIKQKPRKRTGRGVWHIYKRTWKHESGYYVLRALCDADVWADYAFRPSGEPSGGERCGLCLTA